MNGNGGGGMTNEQRLQRATTRLEAAADAMTAALRQMQRDVGEVLTAALLQVQADAEVLAKASGDLEKAQHEHTKAFVRLAEKGAG